MRNVLAVGRLPASIRPTRLHLCTVPTLARRTR